MRKKKLVLELELEDVKELLDSFGSPLVSCDGKQSEDSKVINLCEGVDVSVRRIIEVQGTSEERPHGWCRVDFDFILETDGIDSFYCDWSYDLFCYRKTLEIDLWESISNEINWKEE